MAVVPIFVSSTFVDFNAERDALAGPVRDALDFMARPLGCSVEIVDLRWGVDTDGVTESDAQQRVLDVCLGEIRRCRPLFVGLIGQRYGWRPGRDALDRAVALSAALSDEVDVADDASITELEFVVALAGADPVDPLIFFRQIDGAPDARFVDSNPTPIESFRERVHSLVRDDQIVKFSAALGHEGSLDSEFERVAVERLWPLVERVCAARTVDLGDPYDLVHAHRQADVDRLFDGRHADLQAATASIEKGRNLVLVGQPGVGLSALAMQVAFAQRNTVGAGVYECVVGLTPDSSTSEGVAARLLRSAGVDSVADPIQELVAALSARTEPTTVVIDGLDRIEAGPGRDRLEIVARLRQLASVQLIVTSHNVADGSTLRPTRFDVQTVEPLPVEVSRRVADALVAPRQLPALALDSLARCPRTPLWLRLAASDLLAISSDELCLAQESADPARALNELLISRALELPDELGALVRRSLDRILERVRVRHPAVSADVPRLVAALAVARDGLRSAELRRLVGDDAAAAASFVQSLGTLAVQSGVDGAFRFSSASITSEALAWSNVSRIEAHSGVASVLTFLPPRDPLRASGMTWHAARSGNGELLTAEIEHAETSGSELSRSVVIDRLTSALTLDPSSERDVAALTLRTVAAGQVADSVCRFLEAMYWGTAREYADLTVAEVVVNRLVDLRGRSAQDSPQQYESALLAQADCLSLMGRDEEAMDVVRAADAMLARRLKGQGDLTTDDRVRMLRIHRVNGRHWVDIGQPSKMFASQMQQNLVHKVRVTRSTLDIPVLKELVESHLDTMEALEHGGTLSLAMDAVNPVMLYMDQIAEAEGDDSLWFVTRALRSSINMLRMSVLAQPTNDRADDISGIRELLQSDLLAANPNDATGLRLAAELAYVEARNHFAHDRKPKALEWAIRATAAARSGTAVARRDDRTPRWLIQSLLMESEFARAMLDRTAWSTSLGEAVELCRSMGNGANRNDAYYVVNLHLVALCIHAGPEGLPSGKWGKVLQKHLHRNKPLPVGTRSEVIDQLLRWRDELGPDPCQRDRSNKTTKYLRQHMFVLGSSKLLGDGPLS